LASVAQRRVKVRSKFATAIGLSAVLMMAASPVFAASPIVTDGASEHSEIRTVYFPDDICGPRAAWYTIEVTWHWHLTDLGDGYSFVYTETGTYHVDFDDPRIEDIDSQFTEAFHETATRGGTIVSTEQFHDFPGTITIRVHVMVVEVDGELRVDRVVNDVEGCP
jgi:hypothetical protein